MTGARRLATWVGVIAAGAGVLALLAGLGVRWDPFDLAGRRLARARAEAASAQAEARVAGLERDGERRLRVRVAAVEAGVARAEGVTGVFMEQAGRADDATDPLDAARAARLGAHDRELCRIAPGLDGCAAASDPARDGADAVRPGDPAA